MIVCDYLRISINAYFTFALSLHFKAVILPGLAQIAGVWGSITAIDANRLGLAHRSRGPNGSLIRKGIS